MSSASGFVIAVASVTSGVMTLRVASGFVDFPADEPADTWRRGETGLRADLKAGDNGTLMVDGSYFSSDEGTSNVHATFTDPFVARSTSEARFTGGHLLARYAYPLGEQTKLTLQASWDHRERDGRTDPRVRVDYRIDAVSLETSLHFPLPGRSTPSSNGAREGPSDAAMCAGKAAPYPPRVKKKVAPLSTSPSAHTRPPCRATIRWTVARPIPVPLNSASLCSRWNGTNSFST